MEQKILAALAQKNYVPLKPKALARKIGVTSGEYPEFRRALRDLVKHGRVHVQAGAGIVADSDADYEVRETEAKANGVFEAIRLACEQGDWP